MKVCGSCNSVQPDNARKCTNCGGTNLRDVLVDVDELDNLFSIEKERNRKRKIFLAVFTMFLIFCGLILFTIMKINSDSKKGINLYNKNEVSIQYDIKPLKYSTKG